MCKLFLGFFALIAATQILHAQGIFPTNEICGRLEELGLSHDACEDPMMGVVPNPPAATVDRPKRMSKRKSCCDPSGTPCTRTDLCETSR